MLVQHVQFSVTLIHETPTHNQHSVLSLWSTQKVHGTLSMSSRSRLLTFTLVSGLNKFIYIDI